MKLTATALETISSPINANLTKESFEYLEQQKNYSSASSMHYEFHFSSEP